MAKFTELDLMQMVSMPFERNVPHEAAHGNTG